MFKLLVFAGTTEGRKLVDALHGKGLEVHASVATEYGKMLLSGENIHVGRLPLGSMVDFLRENGFDAVVDATHPYAALVSENIKSACMAQSKPCLRLLRQKSYDASSDSEDCIYVRNTEEAAAFLKTAQGRVLLTTGSKDLAKYTVVPEFEERFFARVLPAPEVTSACNDLGFKGKHLICMQGPFDYEMNLAMLKWLNCKYMVTKDSGKEGGAQEKLAAAKAAGAKLVIIGRPAESGGMSMEEVLTELTELSGICLTGEREQDQAAGKDLIQNPTLDPGTAQVRGYSYFPLFVNISEKKILIVGGGNIALRRIKTLMGFNTRLKIVAKEINRELEAFLGDRAELDRRQIKLIQRPFEDDDILDADIVIAASDDRALNHKIGCLCKKEGILANVADAKEECDFFFPGIAAAGGLIAGVTAQGNNHGLAKEAAEMIRRELECLREK